MSRDLIATYSSSKSTYFEYSDGWTYKSNESPEIPLKNATYMPLKNAANVWESSGSKKEFSEIERLISDNTVLASTVVGGRVISIAREDGKVGIRRSGIITRIEPRDDLSDSELCL